MKKNIITVKDLYVEGKMIAFIKGNRSVNSKNISRKKKSFEKFGMNLVPLMYVDGQKAVNDGCTLVHPITKEDIPDEEASKYVAIVEGQHRYTAAEETGLDEEKLFLYECPDSPHMHGSVSHPVTNVPELEVRSVNNPHLRIHIHLLAEILCGSLFLVPYGLEYSEDLVPYC